MAREGFLTYLENYFKKHDIGLKEVSFELKDIDKTFSIAAETLISQKYNPSVSILRKKGYIKVDQEGKMYIELESNSNIRVIITNEYITGNVKALYVNEEDFEKTAIGMNYVIYEKIKNSGFSSLLKENFKEVPCAANLIKESFKMIATTARKKDQQMKMQSEHKNDKDLLKDVQEIYFVDPETSEHTRSVVTNNTHSVSKHDDISLYERHKLMMDLSPEKVINAKGLNGNNSSYLVCLYNIDKLEDNSHLYAMIMEPKTSYGYTKTAYFKASKEITDEQFQDKAAEYLQYDSNTFFSLANTTRFCHKSIEAFDEMLNAVVFEEYSSPVHKTKLQIAKNTAEEFHQGIVKAKRK